MFVLRLDYFKECRNHPLIIAGLVLYSLYSLKRVQKQFALSSSDWRTKDSWCGRKWDPPIHAMLWLLALSLGLTSGFRPKDSTSNCLVWLPDRKDAAVFSIEYSGVLTSAVDSPQLCRTSRLSALTDSYFDVGIFSNDSCVPILPAQNDTKNSAISCSRYDYIAVRPQCSVWWREVAADVVPPIPELTLSLGSRKNGQKLGICRTFGDHQTRLVDEGVKHVGTFVLDEGSDFGRCVFVRRDGSVAKLEGGLFHILTARADTVCNNNDMLQVELSKGVQARVSSFIKAEDRTLIEKIVTQSGTADLTFRFEILVESVMGLGSCELAEVLSAARFVPSPLNRLGLHLFRCILAERMYEVRVHSSGFSGHPDYPTWRRDGVLIKDLDDPSLGGDAGVVQLLQMVSGEIASAIPQQPLSWTMRNVTVQPVKDQQTDIHVDTFAAITKIWVFPGGLHPLAVSEDQGPLMYAKGSHRNTQDKLTWMHAYAQPPAKEGLREPSFRLHGCSAAESVATNFINWAEDHMLALLPLPSVERTLVIADTSGLHCRGFGKVGSTRHSWRLEGDNDGGLTRLNPFRWPEYRIEL